MSQVLRIMQNVVAEFVTNDAVIQPGQRSFANQDALNAYLVETFGARSQGRGVTGSLSCKGKYVRRSLDDTATITFRHLHFGYVASEGSLVLMTNQFIWPRKRTGPISLAGCKKLLLSPLKGGRCCEAPIDKHGVGNAPALQPNGAAHSFLSRFVIISSFSGSYHFSGR